MAEKTDTLLLDFVGGEVSQYMAARTDLAAYMKSLSWCQNWIVLPQGGLRYKPGSYLVGFTRQQSPAAALIPFQFSASDAMMILATNLKFRFYRNDAVVLNTAVTITGATVANPCVVTAPSHGYSNGQEVYIQGLVGMTNLNNRFFQVENVTTNTFTLIDQFGNAVSSLAFGAYVSGGTVATIYELTTPYLAADLPYIRVDQVGDVMYICCINPTTGAAYPPYKLTRAGLTSWTLATFSRTNDPFAPTNSDISAVSLANPCEVTVASTTGMTTGDIVYITGIVGTTQLNGNFYQITVIDSATLSLANLAGVAVDSSGFTAWSSGGVVTETNTIGPASCAFTGDGRQAYVNTKQNPSGFWASELPSGTTSNFDNFTTGSTDSDAMLYALAPVNGIVDNIQDMIQFSGNIAFLNASTIELMFGAQPGTPPTPAAIGTQPTYQGAFFARGIVINWDLIFIDINQKKLRGMQYNLAFSDYQAIDYMLAAQHLGEESPLVKCIFVKGTPELIWILRADGNLIAFTFNNIEKIQAFARVYLGGGGQVIDIGTIRNSSGANELWMVVQRTVNGQQIVSVEVMAQWPVFPALREFFTAPQNQQSDLASWQNAAWEAGKDGVFLDAALVYDGHDRGDAANATLSLSGTTGSITIGSNVAIFQAADLGQQVWKDYSTEPGATNPGGGRAVITRVVSSTVVYANVIDAFDTSADIAPGAWGFAVDSVQGLDIYDGQAMGVAIDGAAHPAVTIAGGIATLQWFGEVITVGYPFTALAATQNVAPQSKFGPTAYKPRSIKQAHVQLCESGSVFIGPSEYQIQECVVAQTNQPSGRQPPPFSGVVRLSMLDSTTVQAKQLSVVKSDPTPCTVLAIDVEMMTSDPP